MSIKKQIAKSLDFRHFFTSLLYFGIPCIAFAVAAITLSITKSYNALRMASTFLLIILIPITLYYLARIILMYAKAKDYQLCAATATEVHNCIPSLWRSCYFALKVTLQDGAIIDAESNGVFKLSEFSSAYFGSYLNKPLQVLYNPKTNGIIILR